MIKNIGFVSMRFAGTDGVSLESSKWAKGGQRQGANMPFESVPGLKGKVYVPAEPREVSKKYACKDCFSCQHCSDDRCGVCLSEKKCKKGKGYRSWSI